MKDRRVGHQKGGKYGEGSKSKAPETEWAPGTE